MKVIDKPEDANPKPVGTRSQMGADDDSFETTSSYDYLVITRPAEAFSLASARVLETDGNNAVLARVRGTLLEEPALDADSDIDGDDWFDVVAETSVSADGSTILGDVAGANCHCTALAIGVKTDAGEAGPGQVKREILGS